jgi:cytoskeletal protein CcmA (bactofilin family)
MWGNKKPDTPPQPQVAPPQPEPVISKPVNSVNPIINQPPKPVPASSWEEKPAMSTDAMRPQSATSDRSSARLGSSLHVKGEISGSEDLQIDGSVEGLIQLDERKLTVGPSAKVTADIIAREVVVYGTVKGNLRAKDRIEIKKDGSVNGDLTTSRIMIEDGAYFKGSIEIDRTGDKDTSHSAFGKKDSAPATAGKTI